MLLIFVVFKEYIHSSSVSLATSLKRVVFITQYSGYKSDTDVFLKSSFFLQLIKLIDVHAV
jgi:hypothetical protein